MTISVAISVATFHSGERHGAQPLEKTGGRYRVRTSDPLGVNTRSEGLFGRILRFSASRLHDSFAFVAGVSDAYLWQPHYHLVRLDATPLPHPGRQS